jgi:hypothetical protein
MIILPLRILTEDNHLNSQHQWLQQCTIPYDQCQAEQDNQIASYQSLKAKFR